MSDITYNADKTKIDLSGSIHDSIGVNISDRLTTVYLDGISIVSFSPTDMNHIGHSYKLEKEDLIGKLFFNSDFFRSYFPKNSRKVRSDMVNIAKTFFNVNNDNYVALVQYLPESGDSSEHYHTMEESIVQLVGITHVTFRSVEDDTQYKIMEYKQGDIIRIPPYTLHSLRAIDSGTLTIPIKQLSARKDHHYLQRSPKRIKSELHQILREPGYTSGNDIVTAIQMYEMGLRTKEEIRCLEKMAMERINSDKNPNNVRILREYLKKD